MGMPTNTPMSFDTLRASLDHLTVKELQLLQREVEKRLEDLTAEIDWLDTEYMEEARKDADDSITLESVRAALAKIPGSMSDLIIAEREDRF